mgnify:CR=1 FL=1
MALMSFNQILFQLAQRVPDRLAITCETDGITYNALDRYTNRLARAYQQEGIKANALVTVALPNSIEFFAACIALWKLGATPQPVSYRLPKKELQAIVTLANPPLIIGADPDLIPERKALPTGFVAEAGLSDKPLPDMVARHWKAPTSGGSTGQPKLIVSEFPAEFDPESESLVKQLEDRVVLIPGPLYHSGPFTWAMEGLFRGNHIVVMKKFDALETLSLIERHRVDWAVVVPTMMQRIWRLSSEERERYKLCSLRILLHVGAPCPVWLKQVWIDWLGADRIYELYAASEAQGATWITGKEWLGHKGSVGRILDGCKLKIVDEQGQELPAGEIGEVYLLPDAGKGSTYHYLGAEPSATEGGWETLGDMGYLDEDAYLYLCDRKQDMILSGGANIYPAEVEAAIESHPKVRSCLVVGLSDDDDLGQKVHALVDAPGGLTQAALFNYLTDQLVRYKIPRSVEFVDGPLRDDAGKARRAVLTKQSGQNFTGKTS